MDKELKDILDCIIKYTSNGDNEQDAKYLEVIQTDLVMYFKRVLPQANVVGRSGQLKCAWCGNEACKEIMPNLCDDCFKRGCKAF